ncbi:MAG: DNA-directed RNA polymerase subunit alpha [Planctomycetes bacterium]|nr:DNA-directed RNA polymerase subunit alpha [Planctomycetota bacterium]
MRIRWRNLELPTEVVPDESVNTDTYGRFGIEPFERGFGTTIGNSLRRVLLSSLEGAAVFRLKIAGAAHEFTSLPGVLEDVTDIVLNVKALVVNCDADEPKTMKVSRRTKGPVRAGDIEADSAIEIVNPDHLLATLTDDVSFEMEMSVKKGRGYATAGENKTRDQEIGVIPLDAIFSPVIRVRYRTEETRVGQRVNYDRLILEVWTRGTLTPQDAIVESAKILRKHLNPFIQYSELGDEFVETTAPVRAVPTQTAIEANEYRERPIADLDLTVRARNCLEAARIVTIGELMDKTEADLLRLRSFGKTSLREVRRKLADLGLGLGAGVEESEAASELGEQTPSSEQPAEPDDQIPPPVSDEDTGGQNPAPPAAMPAPPGPAENAATPGI